MSKFGTHLVSFFSDKLRDYSLLKQETLKALQEVTAYFQACHAEGKHEQMIDPST